jgi:hypothetical protein
MTAAPHASRAGLLLRGRDDCHFREKVQFLTCSMTAEQTKGEPAPSSSRKVSAVHVGRLRSLSAAVVGIPGS